MAELVIILGTAYYITDQFLDFWYKGDFDDLARRHGLGKVTFMGFWTKSGSWKEGLMHGRGQEEWKLGGHCLRHYVGQWKQVTTTEPQSPPRHHIHDSKCLPYPRAKSTDLENSNTWTEAVIMVGPNLIIESVCALHTSVRMCCFKILKRPNHWYLTGHFYENSRKGLGKMRFSRGDQYEGSWDNSMMHGYGIFTSRTGCWKEGDWERNAWRWDSIVGQKCLESVTFSERAVICLPDKNAYEGRWIEHNNYGSREDTGHSKVLHMLASGLARSSHFKISQLSKTSGLLTPRC